MLNSMPHPKPKPVKAIKAKKRKKKTSRQLLEAQARNLVRDIVLKRDRFCVCPAPKNGHSPVLQSGHLISSVKGSIRFDLRNCNTQCASCNMIHEHYPERYIVAFQRLFGQEAFEKLYMDGESSSKLSTEQLQILCNELTAIKSRQEIDKDFVPRYTQEEILNGTWRKEYGRKETGSPV
jgi:hypothetical protein